MPVTLPAVNHLRGRTSLKRGGAGVLPLAHYATGLAAGGGCSAAIFLPRGRPEASISGLVAPQDGWLERGGQGGGGDIRGGPLFMLTFCVSRRRRVTPRRRQA